MESIQKENFTDFARDFLTFLRDNSTKYNKKTLVNIFLEKNQQNKKYCYDIIGYLIFTGFIFVSGNKKILSLSNSGEKWLKQDNPRIFINILYSKGKGENEIFPYDNIDHNNKSHVITYKLFKDNLSIEEIAENRKLKITTVQNHLEKCLKEGLIVKFDYYRLGFTPENHDIVMSVINSEQINGDITNIKNIKNFCPENITYLQIKCSLSFMFED